MSVRSRVTRLLLLLVGLGWLALAHPQAQSAPVIQWTHDGTNVTHFQIVIGTAETWVVDAGLPTPSGTTYEYALPALPAGQWQVKVRACYGADCQDSAALSVVKMVPAGSTALNYYWVSPTGTAAWANCKADIPPAPSNDAAHCSWSTANYYAAAGDTVFFRAGTYRVPQWYAGIDPRLSGTAGNPITFRAYKDETVIFVPDTGHAYGIVLDGDDYITVSGFTFRDLATWVYITLGGNYNEISYNVFDSVTEGKDVGGGISINAQLSCPTHNCANTHNWFHHNSFSKRVNADPCAEAVDHITVGSAPGVLTSNYDFTSGTTGWTLGTGWAYGASAVHKNVDGTGTLTEDVFTPNVGMPYTLVFTISNLTAGSVTPSIGGVSGSAVSSNGTHYQQIVAGTSGKLTFTPTSTARFTIDEIIIWHSVALDNYNSFTNNTFEYVGHTILDNYGSYTVIQNNISHNEPWLDGCTNWSDGTSITSLTIGTGSKTFTTQAGLGFSSTAFAPAAILYADDMSKAMNGLITAYDNATGVMTVNVTATSGSGTYSNWIIAENANVPFYDNPAYNGLYGHRNFQMSDDYGRPSQYGLVEGNRLGHASNNPGNNGPMNLDVAGPGNIIRYNDIFNGMSSGIYFKYATSANMPCDNIRNSNGDCGGVNNKVYHNTVYHNGYGYNWSVYSAKNAAIAMLGIAQWNAAGTGTTNNVIKNNIVYDNKQGDICALGFYPSGCSADPTDTVTNNWLTANGDPRFVDPTLTVPTSHVLPDLSLQAGSGAIDGAIHLTTATNSGTGSTTLTVADSTYFQDGSFGSDLSRGKVVFPDWIAVGTVGNTVKIASINYATHTITLATPATWGNGASVWPAKKSDGVSVLRGTAPDYGAHESGGSLPAPPAVVFVR